MKSEGPFTIERSIVIRARRSTVFRYFTDSERFASWWGKGSTIDPKPGGVVHICYPGNVTAGGNVVEIIEDARIVFTYGYDDPQKPISRGATRVAITLADHPAGTLLSFVHEVKDEATRDEHVAGWRFQLSLFANVVAREEHSGLDAVVDRYCDAWAQTDPEACERIFATSVADDVSFRDPVACVEGRSELVQHVMATKRHMPGLTLKRDGKARSVQGTALMDWIATGEDGTTKLRGTNVLTLSPGGLIAGIVGIWAPPQT
jgi:uncharacterized protein YndB with AHSA1/START domain